MAGIEDVRDLAEAAEVAALAVHVMPYGRDGMAIFPGTDAAVTAQVDLARRIIAESRRQVREATAQRKAHG